jgi:hypothetical protein
MRASLLTSITQGQRVWSLQVVLDLIQHHKVGASHLVLLKKTFLLCMQRVIDGVDEGRKVPEGSAPHAAAAALLAFFKALPKPFFPDSVSTVCMQLLLCRCLKASVIRFLFL